MDPGTLFGIDVALFALIGLLAGAHCIGMCGPLVTLYASRMTPGADAGEAGGSDRTGGSGATTPDGGRAHGAPGHLTVYEVRQHALFNIGRATSYTILGAAFGALGAAVFVTAHELTPVVETLRGGIGILIGGFVVVTGVYYLFGRSTGGVHLPGLERVTGWLTDHVDRLAGGPGIVGLGAIHGLLPCPVLYPAYLYAFAIGSPTGGAVALAALGIGTIPAVFLYGTLVDAVGVATRRRVHRLLGVAFVALGYVLLAHGLMSVGIHVPHPELPFYDALDVPGAGGHGGH